MSSSHRLCDYEDPPRIHLDKTDADPLATGLAQVCNPAQRLLRRLLEGAKLHEKGPTEDYSGRRSLLRTWRKAMRHKWTLYVPRSVHAADVLMENLQVVANRIWETPIEDSLELPNQRELCEVFLAPHTDYLSPACKLADFGPAPRLVDEDWKRPDRVQHFYAHFRVSATLCFDFAARIAQAARALGMLSACLARMGEFVKWRESAIRWSRTPNDVLAQDVPTQGEIVKENPLVVTSFHDPSFTPPYDYTPLPRDNSRNPFLPGSRHEAHAALAESSNLHHTRTSSHSPTPHHDYASDTSDDPADPLRVGPENCDPHDLINFIHTSTVPRAFFYQHIGPTQPPVVLRSQCDLGNGGNERR